MLKALGLSEVDFLPENKEEPIAWLSGLREVTPRYLMQSLLSPRVERKSRGSLGLRRGSEDPEM